MILLTEWRILVNGEIFAPLFVCKKFPPDNSDRLQLTPFVRSILKTHHFQSRRKLSFSGADESARGNTKKPNQSIEPTLRNASLHGIAIENPFWNETETVREQNWSYRRVKLYYEIILKIINVGKNVTVCSRLKKRYSEYLC